MGDKLVAWVGGASRGIGRAVALRLAREGYSLALSARSESEALDATLRDALAAGVEAKAFPGDLSDASVASRVVSEALAHFGDISACVLCAGINATQPVFATSPESWRAVLSANLDSAFWQTKAFARHFMRRRGGAMVYVSSAAALSGDPLHSAYAASKAGILGLMRSTARELAPFGVRVNAIAPGPIDTDMTASLPQSSRDRLTERIPLGRFGKPEEVASAVSFLLSDGAAYVCGETLRIDGGLT